MQEGKAYHSEYNGDKYEVRTSPNGKGAFTASVYSNRRFVGSIKNPLPTIDETLKESSLIIKAYDKFKNSVDSSMDGSKKDIPYANGTIKLTWVDADDKNILHSQMFPNIDEALKNTSDKKNWMVFELKKINKENNDEYIWILKPYGKYKTYKKGMFISDNKLIQFGLVALSVAGLYFIVTESVKLVKSGKLSIKK